MEQPADCQGAEEQHLGGEEQLVEGQQLEVELYLEEEGQLRLHQEVAHSSEVGEYSEDGLPRKRSTSEMINLKNLKTPVLHLVRS